ncbi:hypothetical protein, partial [Pseudidiomarina salinarum]|uniref:hypothetical protein n=1 Tax=Pseudidiomarina salinarum TaxID=435908 RepID=UPI001E56AEA4
GLKIVSAAKPVFSVLYKKINYDGQSLKMIKSSRSFYVHLGTNPKYKRALDNVRFWLIAIADLLMAANCVLTSNVAKAQQANLDAGSSLPKQRTCEEKPNTLVRGSNDY